jgi:hypothetical protein
LPVFFNSIYLIKDQLASQISSWIHEFRDNDQARLYIDAGFATFAREWWGIDRWRLSKFMTVNYLYRFSFNISLSFYFSLVCSLFST